MASCRNRFSLPSSSIMLSLTTSVHINSWTFTTDARVTGTQKGCVGLCGRNHQDGIGHLWNQVDRLIIGRIWKLRGVKSNPENSVGLNLVVGRWTNRSVKLLRVFFFWPDFQLDKNWNEVTSKLRRSSHWKVRHQLPLHHYAFPPFAPHKAGVPPLQILMEGQDLLVRQSICCQHSLHVFVPHHLQIFYPNVEQAFSPVVKQAFPSVSLLQSWVQKRPRLSDWHLECCHRSLPSTSWARYLIEHPLSSFI